MSNCDVESRFLISAEVFQVEKEHNNSLEALRSANNTPNTLRQSFSHKVCSSATAHQQPCTLGSAVFGVGRHNNRRNLRWPVVVRGPGRYCLETASAFGHCMKSNSWGRLYSAKYSAAWIPMQGCSSAVHHLHYLTTRRLGTGCERMTPCRRSCAQRRCRKQ